MPMYSQRQGLKIMTYQPLFDRFWTQYSSFIDAAKHIHQLFTEQGETVINDHIALRTFNDSRVSVEVLAKPFIAEGYVEKGQYNFTVKKLSAKHYEHPDETAPKVFISELRLEDFSSELQAFCRSLIDKIPSNILNNPEALLFCETPWAPIYYKEYEKLLAESQYAAWMYAFGYRANHFTVNVNALKNFMSIESVNDFLKSHHYELNSSDGEIKGSPKEFLEQSSTLAEKKKIHFVEGEYEVPTCYYEFAKRYPLPNGKLFQGFVEGSADKIFESTDK